MRQTDSLARPPIATTMLGPVTRALRVRRANLLAPATPGAAGVDMLPAGGKIGP
ncbi:MAG TPA: hypothetical protein VFH48_06945 [Chloroflexota bacterium]|nr:hypothetical protein [Chloroflexota bacterium]